MAISMTLKNVENPDGKVRPEGWTDQEWSEYLKWHDSLPKMSDDPSANRAVMVGQNKTKADKEDENGQDS